MSTRTTEFAAQITGDASGAIRALEQVKVRVQDTAKATESANTKVANSTAVLVKNSEKAARGVATITSALYAMEAEGSARVLALGQAVGSFADLLGPKGKVISGAAIVASSIVALFMQAKEKASEATRSIEQDIARLVNAGDFATLTKKLQEIEQGTAGAGFQDGRAAIRQRIEDLRAEVQIAGKSSRFYLERQRAIIEEQKKLRALTSEYDRFYRALTDPRNAPGAPRGVAGQPIVTTANSLERDADDAAKRATESADKLQRAAEDFQAAYSASLLGTARALAEAEQELSERADKGRAELEKDTAARVKGNAELREQVAALFEGAGAYQAMLTAQAQATAVAEAEAKAKAAGLALTDEQIAKIREEIADRLRLTKVLEALRSLDGQNPFAIPAGLDEAGQFADTVSRAASAAAGIATAFGEAGQRMAALLGQSAQLFTNLSRAQQAGRFTDLNGQQQDVGFAGALAGKAGAAGLASAVSSALGVVGAISSIGAALGGFSSQARAEAAALREAAEQFGREVRRIREELDGTSSEAVEGLRDITDSFGKLIAEAIRLKKPIEEINALYGDQIRALRKFAVDFASTISDAFLEATGQADQVQLRKAAERRDADLQDAQALFDAGFIDENELQRLVEQINGIFGAVAKGIADAAAEAAKAEAQRLAREAQARASFEGDVTAREQTLAGDNRGAFITRATAGNADALARAQELFDAGTITAELFERLKTVLGDELADAIKDFDAAVALAAERRQDDLAVRALVAQGRTEEAAALRQEIANKEELRGITDETLIAQIELVQQLEEEFRQAEEAALAAAEARANARQSSSNRVALFDLEGVDALQETLDGYGTAFSSLFRQFDLTKLSGIDGAKEVLRGIFNELAGLSDEEILDRFGMTREEVTAALLDTDAGLDGLASSLENAARASREAAESAREFAEAINQDFLRSTGENKQAEIAAARTRRDNRIKQARQLRLGPDVLDQIETIFRNDVSEIEKRFAAAVPVAESQASGVLTGASGSSSFTGQRRGNTTVVGDFGGLSEITGQSLAGLLREIAINTGERGALVEAILGRGAPASLASLRFPTFPTAGMSNSGTVVQIGTINVQVGAISADGATPAAAGSMVAREIAAQLGRLATQEIRFLGSGVA